METMLPVLSLLLAPAVAGTALLLLGNHRRVRREGGVKWLFAAGVALILASSVAMVWYDVDRDTVRFSFTVTLTPDAPGTVRVSLPVPADESLVASLEISSGATSAMNRSGSEPALDVTLAGTTTVRASAALYRYAGAYDMTRMDSQDSCMSWHGRCNATVSVLVLSGNIGRVQVVGHADWNGGCGFTDWSLDVFALPGERGYPADFVTVVC